MIGKRYGHGDYPFQIEKSRVRDRHLGVQVLVEPNLGM